MNTTIRSQIVNLKRKIAEVEAAALPESDLTRCIDSELDRLENAYHRMVVAAGRDLATLKVSGKFRLMAGMSDRQQAAVVAGALLHAARDLIRADILEAATSMPVSLRMPEGERVAAIGHMRRELYDLELQDEAGVEAGQASRRDDADPRAVLGLPIEVAFDPRVLKAAGIVEVKP